MERESFFPTITYLIFSFENMKTKDLSTSKIERWTIFYQDPWRSSWFSGLSKPICFITIALWPIIAKSSLCFNPWEFFFIFSVCVCGSSWWTTRTICLVLRYFLKYFNTSTWEKKCHSPHIFFLKIIFQIFWAKKIIFLKKAFCKINFLILTMIKKICLSFAHKIVDDKSFCTKIFVWKKKIFAEWMGEVEN